MSVWAVQVSAGIAKGMDVTVCVCLLIVEVIG
jgi:hypothetical protein